MRLNHVKGAEEIIEVGKYYVPNPRDNKGKWANVFGNDNPIKIEIGMGKGDFIIENALKYPDVNFIGIEKFDSILARATQKLEDDLDNLFFIRINALEIDEIFSKEISRIYLNFSDPWPKVRHNSRRLTSKIFLDKYDSIFKNNKEIYMRTDNKDLFSYSLVSLSQKGYLLEDVNLDLHNNLEKELITTEYEDKFVGKNIPILSLIATSNDVQNSK